MGKEQTLSASAYILNVCRCLRDMVKAQVLIEGNDVVIRTREFGDFRTTFDLWANMLFGVTSEETAIVIIKQYKHFINCKLFKY